MTTKKQISFICIKIIFITLDFYYELFFTLRNPSAHSYGNIHYDLERKRAVEAQCFSAIGLNAYIQKNLIDKDTAIKKLNFNIDLLERVSENMSTIKKLIKIYLMTNPQ